MNTSSTSSFHTNGNNPDGSINARVGNARASRRSTKRSSRFYLVFGLSLVFLLLLSRFMPQVHSLNKPPSSLGTQKDGCATLIIKEVSCDPKGGYNITLNITNTSGSNVNQILLTPPTGSSITLSQQVFNQSLPSGALTAITVHLDVKPGESPCFFVTLMSKDGPCCTIRVCPELPQCCATVQEVIIKCNADGSYTLVFTVSNTGQNNVEYIYLDAPTGVTMTPSYFAVSPILQPGNSFQTPPIKITGAHPGTFSFGISLHGEGMKDCCKVEQQITLPPCDSVASCAEGKCCARPPAYSGTTFDGLKKVAAVTGYSQVPTAPALTVFDLSGANSFVHGNNLAPNNAPTSYTGPVGNKWTMQKLGTIFGVALDHQGNIYVTASSANGPPYGTDSFPQGPGRVFKIDNGTGAVSNFGPALPNTADPSMTPASEVYPSLGNISFDCRTKQFFVTNEDDGRIYRMAWTNGQVLSTFDHATNITTSNGSPEATDALGFAPLGERLWAVKVHGNRVYYSVWNEDCRNHNANPAIKNEIWSIGLNSAGDFDPTSKRLEVTMPDLAGTDFSNPVSDISFSDDGKMLLSERTMGCSIGGCSPASAASSTNAHASRVLEYVCHVPSPTIPRWTLSLPVGTSLYKYNIGIGASAQCSVPLAQPANSAGGNDYDYDAGASFRVWATGDILQTSPYIYGLQGIPITGGDYTTSALIGLYGTGSFKTQIGDVAISCPLGTNPY